jgi:4-hydroxythreonine-4-phosphate dehydrogenase
MHDERIRLALTIGDPGGVGPEIAARLLGAGTLSRAEVYLIGAANALLPLCAQHVAETLVVLPDPGPNMVAPQRSFPVLIDTGAGAERFDRRPTETGGKISGRSVELAAAMARAGMIDGIVTGPISKEALRLAGYRFAGHTEMFAHYFDAPRCQMMMVAGALRIVILTRDIPLADVPGAVTAQRLTDAARVAAEALRRYWEIPTPRIAVAALNPHGGDGGVLGREEIETIAPALEEVRRGGIRADGPYPADTLFHDWRAKGYDAFIAIYHDQGMIPFKMASFEEGVNMTIGLPVVRTSVCHGTAFDIAGTGRCSTGSMEAAISLALLCCRAAGKRGTGV